MAKILPTKPSAGAISLIIFCFLASVLVRVAASAPALAQELDGQRSNDISPMMQTDANATNNAEVCEPVGEPSILLAALASRQEQISTREAYIDGREQILKVSEARIAEQLVALRGAEERLAATLAQADDAAENDVAQLTEVYERMKPADAAGIFETMDIQFAAGFFARMRPDAAANIMAELPSDLAYSISVVMAGRNANAPRE